MTSSSWETDERTTLSLKGLAARRRRAIQKTERVAPAPAPAAAPAFRVGDLVVVAPDTSPGTIERAAQA